MDKITAKSIVLLFIHIKIGAKTARTFVRKMQTFVRKKCKHLFGKHLFGKHLFGKHLFGLNIDKTLNKALNKKIVKM